jgi:hypothetical protein
VTEPIHEGEAILFMKVGMHASESLSDIIARKRREIADAGFSMWGYGGTTCHPLTTVQPFVAGRIGLGQVIRLCMQPMQSRHRADPVAAAEFSADGIRWQPLPDGIEVLGSRYALCIRTLEEVSWILPLDETRVVAGNSHGRAGSDYIRGHVDKACLEVTHGGLSHDPTGAKVVDIGLVAEMVEPYAVLLRN